MPYSDIEQLRSLYGDYDFGKDSELMQYEDPNNIYASNYNVNQTLNYKDYVGPEPVELQDIPLEEVPVEVQATQAYSKYKQMQKVSDQMYRETGKDIYKYKNPFKKDFWKDTTIYTPKGTEVPFAPEYTNVYGPQPESAYTASTTPAGWKNPGMTGVTAGLMLKQFGDKDPTTYGLEDPFTTAGDAITGYSIAQMVGAGLGPLGIAAALAIGFWRRGSARRRIAREKRKAEKEYRTSITEAWDDALANIEKQRERAYSYKQRRKWRNRYTT